MAGVGPRRKLDEKGWKYVLKSLFIDIPEIKIKVGERSPPIIAQGYDIFYDRGTESNVLVEQWKRETTKKDKPEDTFPCPS
jgi:hypothetical protein